MSAKKAADDLKTFINKFKNLIEIQEELDNIGSLEQAASEAKSLKAEAEAKKAAVEEEVKDLEFKFAKVQEGIAKAKKDADKIIENAYLEADNILIQAKEKAGSINALYDEQIVELQSQVSPIKTKVNQMKSDCAAAEKAELQKKKDLLDKISKDIEQSESAIKSLEM